jgi:hypothetical protein
MKGTPMSSDDVVDRDPAGVVLGALVELRSVPPDAWTEGSVNDQAVRLDRLAALNALVREAQAMVELSLAESMETDDMPTPVGTLHRVEKRTSTWSYSGAAERMRDDLAMGVAHDVALDVATGELDPMKRNVAIAAMRAAYEAIPSFSELKVAGRRRFGLRMDDYRTYSTRYTVELEGVE